MRYALLAGFAVWTLAAQPAPSQGSIEGQILNDSTGAPLKKVTVRLADTPAAVNNQNRAAARRTMGQETDDQGRFQFSGLPPGEYTLFAQRAGFLMQYYGARRYNTAGAQIPLSQDQHVKDIAIRLTPQGVIVGRILDEDGDPVAYAQVMVFRQMYRDGRKQWSQISGTSASDIAEYRVPNLEPGRYLVAAVSRQPAIDSGPEEPLPQKPEMIYAATYYPNGLSEQAGAPVVLGPGSEARGIDIHLVKTPSYHVRGTVNGLAAGAGRGGIPVNLFHRDGGYNMTPQAQAQPPGNQFDLRGVVPGQYTLVARSGGGPSQMAAALPVAVASGHLTGISLTLAPALDLSGQVRVAETGAAVHLTNVRVSLTPVELVSMAGTLTMASDADGRLTFRNVLPGRYVADVQTVPDGCFVQSVKLGGQEVTRDGVEITSAAPLEVVLSSTAAKIAGSVTDKDGKPVQRATVALIPSDAGARPVSASTDGGGGFTFLHLRPGTYKLLAWEDVEQDAWEDPEFRKPYDSGATEVKVGPGESQTAQLRAIAVEEMSGAK